jgi:hypothetical protein
MVTDAMVDAGRRIAFKGDARLEGVGPGQRALLEGLISPMVDEGRIIAWRGTVVERDRRDERHCPGRRRPARPARTWCSSYHDA